MIPFFTIFPLLDPLFSIFYKMEFEIYMMTQVSILLYRLWKQ